MAPRHQMRSAQQLAGICSKAHGTNGLNGLAETSCLAFMLVGAFNSIDNYESVGSISHPYLKPYQGPILPCWTDVVDTPWALQTKGFLVFLCIGAASISTPR